MKTIFGYILSFLLPGISLMRNRKTLLGISILIVHITLFTWSITFRLIPIFSAKLAMNILTTLNIPLLQRMESYAFIVWIGLAAIATFYQWRCELRRSASESSISSLS